MSKETKDIIILGGGTAGWMAANLMSSHWTKLGFSITLVESPEIGIIGVGEGSTPKLKDFFDTLGIQESEWMPECNATYKNGITFKNWSTIDGFESYFHPFGCTIDALTYKLFKNNLTLRQKGFDACAHPDRFFLMSALANQNLSPKPPQNFPFEFHYSYHFDSVLLGKFLKKKAMSSGVKHVEGTVQNVQLDSDGSIASIKINHERTLSADFFIDCSGFKSVLLQETLKVPFVSFSENLFNDAAIAIPTELKETIPSQTVSTALKHGWAWKIPLTNRYGNGYVYSTRHCSSDQAELELRTHLGILDSDVESRHLKMKVGRASSSWYKNCVAIGLSQGFIEPLEATALQFVHSSIEEFIQAFTAGNFTNKHRETFNRRINANFEGIRDYIVLHYKTNSREDTEYWCENRNNINISSNLQAMLESWNKGINLESTLRQLGIHQYYTSISWNCLLAGVGSFSVQKHFSPINDDSDQVDLNYIDNFIAGCTLNFEDHKAYLKKQRL